MVEPRTYMVASERPLSAGLLTIGGSVLFLAIALIGCSRALTETKPTAERDLAQHYLPAEHDASFSRPDTAILISRNEDGSPLFSTDRYDALLLGMEGSDSLDTTDYSDPTLGGAVPLLRVAGREDYRLSDHLRLGDFAASDGAGYARVSSELIEALEVLMTTSDQPIGITSGYRHPALNARNDIRGAARSMHIAGFAADIWSPGLQPIELAELALDMVGCQVGIGLGRSFIHLDMRGRLASWATDDAAYSEEEFDRFVLFKCTGRDLGDAASAAAKMALLRSSHSVREETKPERRLIAAAQFVDEMSAVARVQSRYGYGAVLLDTRESSIRAQGSDAEYVLGYIRSGTLEARSTGVENLLARAPAGCFVYVLMRDEVLPEVGMMSLENQNSTARAVAIR